MKNIKQIIQLIAVAVLFVSCSQSLEDTYADYSGDGRIRYVAKCDSIIVKPGWERLIISWVNGIDATTDKIKVVWTNSTEKKIVLLPSNSTSYILDGLSTDDIYRFDVSALDYEGNESLIESNYGRPYTKDHEIMMAFTRGVVKSYFIGTNMFVFTDKWSNNISEIKLEYVNSKTGEVAYKELEKKDFDKFLTIPDVSDNNEDDVRVLRKGKPEGCEDIIEFAPYIVSRHKNFSSGFVKSIETRYGYNTKTPEDEAKFRAFIDTVRVLEFDEEVEHFEDILYCTNLNNLVFGKNRYLQTDPKYKTDKDYSKIKNGVAKSKLILDAANKYIGLTIECYGDKESKPLIRHYLDKGYYFKYVKDMGYSILPSMTVIDTSKFRKFDDGEYVLCEPKDPFQKLNRLLDDNPATHWSQEMSNTIRTYSLNMELKEIMPIKGIKVAQPLYVPGSDEMTPIFMTDNFTVQVSTDGSYWSDVRYYIDNKLGMGSGEVTLLEFPEGPRDIKYIKIKLKDKTNRGGSSAKLILGDIVLYQ